MEEEEEEEEEEAEAEEEEEEEEEEKEEEDEEEEEQDTLHIYIPNRAVEKGTGKRRPCQLQRPFGESAPPLSIAAPAPPSFAAVLPPAPRVICSGALAPPRAA